MPSRLELLKAIAETLSAFIRSQDFTKFQVSRINVEDSRAIRTMDTGLYARIVVQPVPVS